MLRCALFAAALPLPAIAAADPVGAAYAAEARAADPGFSGFSAMRFARAGHQHAVAHTHLAIEVFHQPLLALGEELREQSERMAVGKNGLAWFKPELAYFLLARMKSTACWTVVIFSA